MVDQVTPAIGDELGLGDHVAFFFKSNAERLAFVIPYMACGLRRSERCVYIADENSKADILAELAQAGVDTREAQERDALSIGTKHESYLRHGMFEPEKMMRDLDRDVSLALQRGFSGLRVTGEMSWALDLPTALGQLCEYEERLHRRWPAQLGGLCQYNESLFPADLIQRMIGCHCIFVRDGAIVRHHAHRPPGLGQSQSLRFCTSSAATRGCNGIGG